VIEPSADSAQVNETMTAASGAVVPNARTGAPAWLTALGTSTALWVFGVDIILVLVFGLLSPDRAFLSARAFQALGLDASEGLILATGIALLLGAGEIDLSLGANLLLSSVVGAKIIVSFGSGSTTIATVVGVLGCLATGAAVGVFNGLVTTRLRVVSLIATLATLGIATGIANIITDGTDITGLPQSLQTGFGIRTELGIPLPAFVAFAVWLITLVLFRTTRYGMRILALGSNRGAAQRAGLRVNLHIVVMFALVGMLAGVAGFIDLTRFATTNIAGHTNDGLSAITAAVIGGTSLFGGRVSLAGVLSGTLLAVILEDGLIVVGLSPFYQLIAIGVVLIAAVSLDQYRRPGGIRLRLLR
jgi:ribose transport system permease protein